MISDNNTAVVLNGVSDMIYQDTLKNIMILCPKTWYYRGSLSNKTWYALYHLFYCSYILLFKWLLM